MNSEYVLLRVIRRHTPTPIIRFMLRKNLIIKGGSETNNPKSAVERYEKELSLSGKSIKDRVVLDFGYGGSLGVAIELLRRGARHVYLVDKYAKPDHKKNIRLLEEYPDYRCDVRGHVEPNPQFITVIRNDTDQRLQDLADSGIDIVLSSSVFEHLDDTDRATDALMKITARDGIHVHFIDLRDHFFRYPFEMLCYSRKTWERFLNPPSNLNRLRARDYERVFKRCFSDVECRILSLDPDSYRKVKNRIRPEFTTGGDQVDSATCLVIKASKPLREETEDLL